MLITKKHPFTGDDNTMDLDVTQEQLDRLKTEKIQHVLPHLTADEREFIKSGLLPDEFDSLFP